MKRDSRNRPVPPYPDDGVSEPERDVEYERQILARMIENRNTQRDLAQSVTTDQRLDAIEQRQGELEARISQLENWHDTEVEIARAEEYYGD